ncbi:MAG: hypothetical protein FWC65_03515, partial [Treponema sp.]|nr:hypothetical protein [Treponema sp.]
MKKNLILSIVAIVAVSLSSCATMEVVRGASLLDAIKLSAERLARDIPAGSRVAIVAFESEHQNLSGFIMEELAGALIDIGIEVVDRQNLELVSGELEFQMTGFVSDETALS